MLSDTEIAIFYEAGYKKPYEGIAYKVVPINDFK
jgi:hypothetical protein